MLCMLCRSALALLEIFKKSIDIAVDIVDALDVVQVRVCAPASRRGRAMAWHGMAAPSMHACVHALEVHHTH